MDARYVFPLQPRALRVDLGPTLTYRQGSTIGRWDCTGARDWEFRADCLTCRDCRACSEGLRKRPIRRFRGVGVEVGWADFGAERLNGALVCCVMMQCMNMRSIQIHEAPSSPLWYLRASDSRLRLALAMRSAACKSRAAPLSAALYLSCNRKFLWSHGKPVLHLPPWPMLLVFIRALLGGKCAFSLEQSIPRAFPPHSGEKPPPHRPTLPSAAQ